MYTNKTTLNVADAVMKVMEAEQKKAKMDHDQDGKIESPKAEYLGSRIRAAKMAGKLKENEQVNEAFPTVADGEKALRAKEGKTSMGTVTKTKTGIVHTRDYEDDSDETPAKKGRPTGGGAGKTTKKKKLSEMLGAYREKGISSLYEEPDNETFTKEFKDQKAKFDGKKKGADVAKPAVQAVKMEETDYEEDDGPLTEDQIEQIKERTLTPSETAKKETVVKSMKKGLSGFRQRYGDRAKEVMYATATKIAKKD